MSNRNYLDGSKNEMAKRTAKRYDVVTPSGKKAELQRISKNLWELTLEGQHVCFYPHTRSVLRKVQVLDISSVFCSRG